MYLINTMLSYIIVTLCVTSYIYIFVVNLQFKNWDRACQKNIVTYDENIYSSTSKDHYIFLLSHFSRLDENSQVRHVARRWAIVSRRTHAVESSLCNTDREGADGNFA